MEKKGINSVQDQRTAETLQHLPWDTVTMDVK